MAQDGRLFNGSGLAERIFHDLDLTLPVDQRQIKADVGELALWFTFQKLRACCDQTIHLLAPEPCRCAGETGAFLDLDKDDLRPVTANEVDFATLPAPPHRSNRMRAGLIMARDTVFGGKACVISD